MDPEGSLLRSHGPVNCSHPAPAETSLLNLIQFLFNINYSIASLRVAFFKNNLNNKIKLPLSVSASAVHIIKENEFRSCCLQSSVYRTGSLFLFLRQQQSERSRIQLGASANKSHFKDTAGSYEKRN
jgi:hypothetical protein